MSHDEDCPEVDCNNNARIGPWTYNPNRRCRCWDIVIFQDITGSEMKWEEEMSKFDYSVYQIEKCPSSGREHIQGAVWHENKITASWIRNLFPSCSIRPSKCDVKLINYCKKEKSRIRGPYEYGERKPKGQGFQSRLEEACNEFHKNGITGVLDKYLDMYIKYNKGFDNITIKRLNIPRSKKPKFYHLRGTFLDNMKTVMNVIDNKDDKSYHIQDLSDPFWDGYKQQSTLVCLWTKNFKNIDWIMSEHPYLVSVKGGKIHLNSPLVFMLEGS